jgi:hypothetical protein
MAGCDQCGNDYDKLHSRTPWDEFDIRQLRVCDRSASPALRALSLPDHGHGVEDGGASTAACIARSRMVHETVNPKPEVPPISPKPSASLEAPENSPRCMLVVSKWATRHVARQE